MSSQKKQPAKVIELSGEDILALAGDAKGQEERNLSVEAIREEILDYPNSILLAGFSKPLETAPVCAFSTLFPSGIYA